MNGIFHLKGAVKHYDWGGFSFLPALLKRSNAEKKPFAEYWMGTHAQGMGELELPDGSMQSLIEKTGPLPFLFKVLDVKDMLSIQVHPSRQLAEEGFEEENKKGIPVDAPGRNYRDNNHKPELVVAMSDFWLLHGFKPTEELSDILTNISELNDLLPVFHKKGYEGLYRVVMEMPQEKVNQVLQPLVDRIVPLYRDNPPDKNNEDYWAAKAALGFNKDGNIDRGIFSIYFFNLLKLNRGEGIFQAAGVPHAYLEGQNIEIMANSDNVVRGGLTTKHIDVPELLKLVKAEPTFPKILLPVDSGKGWIYPVPVDDFELHVTEMKKGDLLGMTIWSTEIILCIEGKVELSAGLGKLELAPGTPSALAMDGRAISVEAIEDSILFVARAGEKKR